MEKIGLGGSCHWCTEAIFQSLKGVERVEQGWIAAKNVGDIFSEAVIVHYKPELIPMSTLLAIHLATHSSTSDHWMRNKYRSAVYVFSESQGELASAILQHLQQTMSQPIITTILPFGAFKENIPAYQNYYFTDTNKPFCKAFIDPKLKEVIRQFGAYIREEKLAHLLG